MERSDSSNAPASPSFPVSAAVSGSVPVPPGGVPWGRTLAIRAADGVMLRAVLWQPDAPRGLALFLNGRTEFVEKAMLPAAELMARGFAVASLDWRGQGLSDRLLANRLKGHVGRFSDYLLDLEALLAVPEVSAVPGPRVVIGHSMGGAIALSALGAGRCGRVDALVLSAPLLGIELTRFQRAATGAILAPARLLRLGERWPPMPRPERPYLFSDFEGNVLTSDRALFEWTAGALRADARLRLGAPTMGWLDAVLRETVRLRDMRDLTVPSLVVLGTQERVVAPGDVREGAGRIGAEVLELEDALHDLLFERAEIRAALWDGIDRFLERTGRFPRQAPPDRAAGARSSRTSR